jgi:hypothetical protein
MSAHNTDGQLPVNPRPNLTVVPHAEEGASAARLRRNLNRMMRGRRVSRRHTLRALVIEHVLIGRQRDASSTSYAENLTGDLGKAASDHVLGKTHRTLDGLASKADRIRGEQAMLRTRAGYRRGDFVAHPDGGVRTVTETVEDQDSQRAKITAAIDAGSYRHRRLSKALRRVPVIIFISDALLLMYFGVFSFSGVTNVDWTSPLSAALIFAVMLAVMVTCISFACFRLAGDLLRHYKNDAGTVPLRGLDDATMVIAGLALAAIAVLATLMYLRMHVEVIDALGSSACFSAVLIGLTLATVSILANIMVIAVHGLNGSPEADRLDALGSAVGKPLSNERKLNEDADAREKELAILARKAERVTAKGFTAAGHQCAASDRYIDAARAVHRGVGPLSEPAVNPNDHEGVVGYHRTAATPEVDERPVRLCLQHVSTPLPGRQQPANSEHAADPEPSSAPEQTGEPTGPARAAHPEQPAA